MSSPVCLEAVPAKRFLTTLGESTKRWLSALSLMYMEMERWHVPTAFHIRVPRIAKDEWRCNGGKCTQPNHTVPTLSLAGLFPHHAPKRFAHTVRFAVGSDDIGNCRAATRGNNSIDADGGATGRAYRLALDTVAFDATHNVSDCSKCGYLFLRRPLRRAGLNGSLVAAMVNLSSKSTQFYSSTPFDLVAHASRMIAAAHKLSCMEVNYDAGRSRDVKPAHVLDVLRGNGTSIRFYHRKRPSGTASNAHGMMCAMQAGLLVTELGTQWTDFPMEKRCASGLKSIVLGRSPDGEVLHAGSSCNEVGRAEFGRTIPIQRAADPSLDVAQAFRIPNGTTVPLPRQVYPQT